MPITAIDPAIVQALGSDAELDGLAKNSYRRSLADMLRRNGPLQTVAFLHAKPEGRPLLAAVERGLGAFPGHPAGVLALPKLAELPALELLALTQRLTRVAVWIDRLVEARGATP